MSEPTVWEELAQEEVFRQRDGVETPPIIFLAGERFWKLAHELNVMPHDENTEHYRGIPEGARPGDIVFRGQLYRLEASE